MSGHSLPLHLTWGKLNVLLEIIEDFGRCYLESKLNNTISQFYDSFMFAADRRATAELQLRQTADPKSKAAPAAAAM